MKFYNDKKEFDLWHKIKFDNLTAILNSNNPINNSNCVYFFKNGENHNTKNASYFSDSGRKNFCLNDEHYGNQKKFTKKSWHRFVKLQVFK